MARKPQPERTTIHTSLYLKADANLLQEIWYMQAHRTYMKTFRDAFRLILSLQRRETDVLLELFPWIKNEPINHTQLNYIQYLQDRIRELE